MGDGFNGRVTEMSATAIIAGVAVAAILAFAVRTAWRRYKYGPATQGHAKLDI
jgi:hypothetical protein